MNRGLAVFASLLYIVGGVFLGLVGHQFFVGYFGEVGQVWLKEGYVMLLPAILVIALAVHFMETLSARKAGTNLEGEKKKLGEQLEAANANIEERKLAYSDLRARMDDQKAILEWCKQAIGDASVRRIPEQVSLAPLDDSEFYDDPDRQLADLREKAVQPPKDYSEHTEGTGSHAP